MAPLFTCTSPCIYIFKLSFVRSVIIPMKTTSVWMVKLPPGVNTSDCFDSQPRSLHLVCPFISFERLLFLLFPTKPQKQKNKKINTSSRSSISLFFFLMNGSVRESFCFGGQCPWPTLFRLFLYRRPLVFSILARLIGLSRRGGKVNE